jgi:hypothetical protein
MRIIYNYIKTFLTIFFIDICNLKLEYIPLIWTINLDYKFLLESINCLEDLISIKP